MEGRDTEDSWGDRVTQRPVTLSHGYNVMPSFYKHPVSARDNVCRGSRRGSELIYELAKINMDGPTPENKKKCNFLELCDKRTCKLEFRKSWRY